MPLILQSILEFPQLALVWCLFQILEGGAAYLREELD